MSTRREFLRRSALIGGTATLAPSLSGLIARLEGQPLPAVRTAGIGEGGYGPLRYAGPELALPEDFQYWVISENGMRMSDGRITPTAFDGMGAFALPNGNIRLIRNHENRDTPDVARPKGDPALAYDRKAGGGTVSLEVRITPQGEPELVGDFISLSGTFINCAGGTTPWGTWLSCEETVAGPADGWEQPHGYVFEVPAAATSEVRGVPLKAMGRFVHEAVAVDPRTGVVYLTEDRNTAGFYRFLPRRRDALAEGGTLQMLRVLGRPRYDTARGQVMGRTLPVDWVTIEDPDPTPKDKEDYLLVFTEGQSKGGARFSRLEGCWPGDGGIFFHATDGGDARVGQVWFYRPTSADRGELTLVFESPSRDLLDYPDNITVSPRGGIVICEDGAGEQYVRGLTRDGKVFDLARNLANTTEFAGACFSPDGETLFVNILGNNRDAGRHRSLTLAIRGPWRRGSL